MNTASPPMDGEMADVLFGLGRSQFATSNTGALEPAIDNFLRALDYYASIGDIGRVVNIEYPLPTGAMVLEDTRLLVSRALELVESDSHEAGRLASRAGMHLGRTSTDYEGAQELFRRALMIAQREVDIDMELMTLANMAEVDLFHLQLEQSQQNAQKAIEAAHRVNNLQAEVQAHQRAVLASIITGNTAGAHLHASSGLDLAERLQYKWWLATTLWGNQTVSQLVGDWQDAGEFGNRGLAAAPNDMRMLGNRVLLDYEEGNNEKGDLFLEKLLQVTAQDARSQNTGSFVCSFVVPLSGRATGSLQGIELARRIARDALSSMSVPPLLAAMARSGLALIAVVEGDIKSAQEQYDALHQQRGMLVPNCAGCTVDRILGLLSQTIGNLDQAAGHFENSLAFCRKAGYRPELAWTCCDYADTLLLRNGDGDRDKATSLLDESLAVAKEVGMKLLMERVLSRREMLIA